LRSEQFQKLNNRTITTNIVGSCILQIDDHFGAQQIDMEKVHISDVGTATLLQCILKKDEVNFPNSISSPSYPVDIELKHTRFIRFQAQILCAVEKNGAIVDEDVLVGAEECLFLLQQLAKKFPA
jgi:hypothetical protein